MVRFAGVEASRAAEFQLEAHVPDQTLESRTFGGRSICADRGWIGVGVDGTPDGGKFNTIPAFIPSPTILLLFTLFFPDLEES